jgi:hypothetical protein
MLCLFDYIANKMVSYVDMLGACMIIVILGEGDCGLVIAVQRNGFLERAEQLSGEPAKPHSLT